MADEPVTPAAPTPSGEPAGQPNPPTPAPAPAPAPAPHPAPAPAPQPSEPAPTPQPAEPAAADRVESLPKWAQQRLAQADEAAHTALVRLALYENADEHGANPAALADSLSFQAAVAGLDPSDTPAIVAAAKDALTRNPALKSAPAAPPRGVGELVGAAQPPTSPAATAAPGLDRMRAAYATAAAS
ncbi:hypothetical protein [Streptomyces cinereoruber]|uniref:hypothetical protein n=1 Tax=Streptomyces cinereoruber TaxID=67260 RepID=UPI0033970DBC